MLFFAKDWFGFHFSNDSGMSDATFERQWWFRWCCLGCSIDLKSRSTVANKNCHKDQDQWHQQKKWLTIGHCHCLTDSGFECCHSISLINLSKRPRNDSQNARNRLRYKEFEWFYSIKICYLLEKLDHSCFLRLACQCLEQIFGGCLIQLFFSLICCSLFFSYLQ